LQRDKQKKGSAKKVLTAGHKHYQ